MCVTRQRVQSNSQPSAGQITGKEVVHFGSECMTKSA